MSANQSNDQLKVRERMIELDLSPVLWGRIGAFALANGISVEQAISAVLAESPQLAQVDET